MALFTIVFRTLLCVSAVLILVAVTPFRELTEGLRRLRLPAVFISLFEMTYRYLGTLAGEALSMYTAYSLRGGGKKGWRCGTWAASRGSCCCAASTAPSASTRR